MERRLLQTLMIALGAAAVLIGASMILLGIGPTAATTDLLMPFFAPRPAETFSPTVDSELRFYAPLWIFYGLALIHTARKLAERLHRVPVLAGLFFAGGVGRALSYVFVGPPRPPFIVLMIIELVLPVIFIGLWARLRPRP